MVLHFYFCPLSNLSRAVWLFLKATGIPHQEHIIDMWNQEQLTAEYEKINPFKKIPAIVDGEFHLAETVAIMRYLTEKHKDIVAEHWYPQDLQKRAKIDEYMSYHPVNTRQNFGHVFQDRFSFPVRMKKYVPHEQKTKNEKMLETTATEIENLFLKDNKFLCGDDVTLADVLAFHDIVLLNVTTGPNPLDTHAKLAAWRERLRERLNPHFDEVLVGLEFLKTVPVPDIPKP